MTTVEKLNYLISIKSDIKTAIENKGVDMTGVSFPGYASKIGDIVSGVGYTDRDVIEGRYQYNIYNSASFVYSSTFEYKLVETVDLPNCSYVGRRGFFYCTSLTTVNLPVCITVGISAFTSCSSLSQVNLPVCTTVDSYAFKNCSLLSQVNLPMCSYISISAFCYCSSLTQVSLPMCSYIGSFAFEWCKSLSQVSLPMCSYIGSFAFYNCSSLPQISLPMCSYIGAYAFKWCESLSIITIGYSSVCSLDNTSVFDNTKITSSTGSIYVPSSLVDLYKSATNWSQYSNRIFAIPS